VECFLWPHGSGHLCLKTHYGEAIQQVFDVTHFPRAIPIQICRVLIFCCSQLYPGEGCGWTEEEKEEGVQNYLLMKDLEALQVRLDNVMMREPIGSVLCSGNFGSLVVQTYDQRVMGFDVPGEIYLLISSSPHS
jgi:hypothetical protein